MDKVCLPRAAALLASCAWEDALLAKSAISFTVFNKSSIELRISAIARDCSLICVRFWPLEFLKRAATCANPPTSCATVAKVRRRVHWLKRRPATLIGLLSPRGAHAFCIMNSKEETIQVCSSPNHWRIPMSFFKFLEEATLAAGSNSIDSFKPINRVGGVGKPA